MKPAPSTEEFIKMLEDSLAYCKEADDRGSVDFEMGRWQEFWKEIEPILDEKGGI